MECLEPIYDQLNTLTRNYMDILRDYLKVENLTDIQGNFIKCGLQIIEETRVRSFIYRIINGRITEEEFIKKFKKYANKKQLIEIIERQRRSHSEIINVLCAVIIEDDFNNNIPFSYTQLNHINFLLELTVLDLYNLLQIYKINNSNNGRGAKRDEYMRLELGSVIKFKLDNGGYTNAGTLSALQGDIQLIDTYYDLMENRLLKYFSIEELEHIIRRSN